MSQRYQYTYKPNGSMYLNNPIDQGPLAVQFDNRVADEHATIQLVNRITGDYLYLWIEEMGADFSLTGSTAQSRIYRQFFPRAFNQPHFSLTGRVANDRQFNELAEFVRESQVNGIHYAQAPLKLMMPYRGLDGVADDRIDYKRHIGWAIQGYIPNIRGGASRFNPAPQFNFDFVISYNQADNDGQVGLMQDGNVKSMSRRIMNWMEIIAHDQSFSGRGFNVITDTEATALPDDPNVFGPLTSNPLTILESPL